MIDIHHHLLSGLDDGATSLDISLQMGHRSQWRRVCACASALRMRTGSMSTITGWLTASLLSRELQWRLDEEKIPLTLGRGCDFHMSYDNIQEAKADPEKYSVNGLGYLLVELPDYGISHNMTEAFYQLQLAGLTPILTHPERNATLQGDEPRMQDWLRGGVLVQVTAGSVTGKMGKTAQKMAHRLLEKRWVHFLATDAHNTIGWPPLMREAFELVVEK